MFEFIGSIAQDRPAHSSLSLSHTEWASAVRPASFTVCLCNRNSERCEAMQLSGTVKVRSGVQSYMCTQLLCSTIGDVYSLDQKLRLRRR
jgi:hypothetical protein